MNANQVRISIIFSVLILVASPSFAGLSRLKCETVKSTVATGAYPIQLNIEADLYTNAQAITNVGNSLMLINPSVTAQYSNFMGDEIAMIGRRDILKSDPKYSPRKYKDHVRFDLSQLIETTEFRDFYPSDQCQIFFLHPRNSNDASSYQASAIVSCDQSGGSQTLNCAITASKR